MKWWIISLVHQEELIISRFLEEPVDSGRKGISFIASHKRPSFSQQTRVFLLSLEPQHNNHLLAKYCKKRSLLEPVWVTKFDHSISVTQFPSLITHHSLLITQFFTSVCLHHSISITHYFSHYLGGPRLSQCSFFFFFSSVPRNSNPVKKKNQPSEDRTQ